MRAISLFSRELGISALSCNARFALRILVSMSAIGSVCNATRPYFHNWSSDVLSPTTFRHSGDHAMVREVAQADPAEPELLVDRARAAAAVAARVRASLEPLRLARLLDQRLACHYWFSPSWVSRWNGIPRARRSARPSSSFAAVVVIATSRPRMPAIWS